MSNFRLEDELIPRTKQNLELVLMHPELGFNEITQLMNSMVGLLIFPQQRYFNSIEQLRLDDFPKKNWPTPQIFLWEGLNPDLNKDAITLQQIIRYMRHSVSHATFKFESSGHQIERVHFTNRDPRTKLLTDFSFDIDQYKEFIFRFVDMILEIKPTQETRNAN